MAKAVSLRERWPGLAAVPPAIAWLSMRADLGLADRTIDAYGRGLSEYLSFCAAAKADPLFAGREHVARFVRDLTDRPSRHLRGTAALSSGCPRLANATVQQRLTAIRLFYDHLVEEGLRDSNPVGRGRYAPGARAGGNRRGLVPRQTRLPWIPDEAEWRAILHIARHEPIRNRTMLALGYDAGLRREELCSLRTDDLDPGTDCCACGRRPPKAGASGWCRTLRSAVNSCAPTSRIASASAERAARYSCRNHGVIMPSR
jgi:site-specific recombinase XerD